VFLLKVMKLGLLRSMSNQDQGPGCCSNFRERWSTTSLLLAVVFVSVVIVIVVVVVVVVA